MEFQCLPSGLHSVKEDLVYFVHGQNAGVSAFVQEEADEGHRNANFVTVGALVPLTYGRLGRSWLHAPALRRLAKECIRNANDKRALEQYWKEHQQDGQAATEPVSPSMVNRVPSPTDIQRKRKRGRSDASTTLSSPYIIEPDHPACAITELLDTFGPLIFPICRAALLRKRILLLGTAPVQQSCYFVYLLSILSNIPQDSAEVVQPESDALLKIQTLFNVGIHDITFLSDPRRKSRWLACTTDDILGEKKDLWDVLVRLPSYSGSSRPRIVTSDDVSVRATQRDLRRYRLLRAELDRLHSIGRQAYRDDPDSTNEGDDSEAVPLMRSSTLNLLDEVKRSEPNETEAVEPVSWTAMAYNGFMWWASAGEMQAWEAEETSSDRQLLDDLPEIEGLLPRPSDDSEDSSGVLNAQATATIMTAYFHRLTAQIIQPLADLVEEADDDTEEGIAESAIVVSSDDVRAMGLDNWSFADKEFVKNMMQVYFAREAIVDAGGTRICGVRVC